MIEGVPEFPEKCSTLDVMVMEVLDDKTAWWKGSGVPSVWI
jgi:hypothetical protein